MVNIPIYLYNHCSNNDIGQNGTSIIIHNASSYNTFGGDCALITLAPSSNQNYFADGCQVCNFLTMELGECNFMGPVTNMDLSTMSSGAILGLTVQAANYYDFTGVDFTLATIIKGNYDRTIYMRPDGTYKIRFMDNTDNWAVANVND